MLARCTPCRTMSEPAPIRHPQSLPLLAWTSASPSSGSERSHHPVHPLCLPSSTYFRDDLQTRGRAGTCALRHTP
ncbi:hypothetical protein BX661DRAFT_187396 [Kickxella alabastrina]|uniref:uncharacterized protein n=1 Tax=Kickxella alabastrina TaxID=61397 RepID=UPI002220F11C|nr:uncharacterized protein BX661DRAFT_187396 [Kickxella alabastrina]KAI7822438.1 hypothetical protein BX661DRAFT_187396 [Kickxella alabastrina]